MLVYLLISRNILSVGPNMIGNSYTTAVNSQLLLDWIKFHKQDPTESL